MYVEINTKCGKKMVLGSLYQAPNTNYVNFTMQLHSVLDTVKGEKGDKDLILSMDHNMDLLKCNVHKSTKEFLDGLVDHQIMPTITQPTRITQTSTMLIYNKFMSDKLHKSFNSSILLLDILDHLPSLVLLKQTKILNKDPLEFESRNLKLQQNR